MKLLKNLFVLGLLVTSFSACSGNGGGNNYVSIGETTRTGNLSQTIKRLDYNPSSYGLSENESEFELEFTLHSYFDSIVALKNVYNYSVVFDGKKDNGGILLFGSSKTPTSIAPDKDETVILDIKCFKDWKTAVISYSDYNNNITYSFSLRSSDYPDYTNNSYPVLKQNDSFASDDGKAEITFKSLKASIIGSAGVASDFDNLEFIVSLTSLHDENISLPSTYRYNIKCDAGFSRASFNVGTENLPTLLPAKGTVNLTFIIVLSKQWKKMVFGCDDGVAYKFMILHSDVTY